MLSFFLIGIIHFKLASPVPDYFQTGSLKFKLNDLLKVHLQTIMAGYATILRYVVWLSVMLPTSMVRDSEIC